MPQGIRSLAVIGLVACCGIAAAADEPPRLPGQPENQPAAAPQPTPPPAAMTPAGVRLELTGRAWLMGVSGDVEARGAKATMDASAMDFMDEKGSMMAFSGRLEAGRGKWGAFLDGTIAQLGAEDQSGPVGGDIGVDFTMGILEFGAMYRLGEWVTEGRESGVERSMTFDLYAGGRYNYVELDVSPPGGGEESKVGTWVDPIFGARLVAPLGQHWELRGSADVGGFGVASDLAYSVTAMAGYQFRMFGNPATAYAGYRVLAQDYGANRFTWDVVLHGPLLGLKIEF
ncbi:MAG: hypothetical protein IT437_06025 [Phycisphaerales bacterium]|nr:hypothetical protein [Phycisphaerales bacterium]